MEPEDLNPRCMPSRSPTVPLVCTPSVPEVSLMLNNPHWLNPRTFSPVENISRMSEYQKSSSSGYGVTNVAMTRPKTISSFRGTDYNTQRKHALSAYEQQLEKLNHTSREVRETSYGNKPIGRTFKNTDEHPNIYTDTTVYNTSKEQTQSVIHQLPLNKQGNSNQDIGYFSQTNAREVDDVNSNNIEHYKGWRTYFEDQISVAEHNVQRSFRSESSSHISSKEERSYSNPVTQNHHNTPFSVDKGQSQESANNKENDSNIKEVTESQLQNIVFKILSNLENFSNRQNDKECSQNTHQTEVQINNCVKSLESEGGCVNNRHDLSVSSLVDKQESSNEKKTDQCTDHQLIDKRELQTGISHSQNQNLHLPSNKSDVCSTFSNNAKSTNKTHNAEDETCIQKCDCNVSFTKLYKLLRSQSTHLQLLQEKVDKIIRQQENTLKISENSLSQKEQTDLLSGRRPRMAHMSTQTAGLFHREIAVGTDPQETASVGCMTETTDTSEHDRTINIPEHDGAVSHRRQVPSVGTYEGSRKLRQEETVSEDLHHQDSICLNSLDIQSMQAQAPSPIPSIHIDMQDFEDDDDDSNSSSSNVEEDQPAKVDWTFYNKVVDQVNKLLKKPSTGRIENQGLKYKDKDRHYDARLREVRIATIEQLRKMGISFHDDLDQEFQPHYFDPLYHPHVQKPFDTQPSDSDTSVQINALAMKYLKEENYGGAQLCNISMKTTNYSLATLRYLERYHLLPPDFKQPHYGVVNHQGQAKSTQNVRSGGKFDKILDVTAIKNQPKLL